MFFFLPDRLPCIYPKNCLPTMKLIMHKILFFITCLLCFAQWSHIYYNVFKFIDIFFSLVFCPDWQVILRPDSAVAPTIELPRPSPRPRWDLRVTLVSKLQRRWSSDHLARNLSRDGNSWHCDLIRGGDDDIPRHWKDDIHGRWSAAGRAEERRAKLSVNVYFPSQNERSL